MDESTADQLARHLTEVAVNDPGQLPWAMMSMVQYEVMVALVNSLWCEISSMLEEWEETLRFGGDRLPISKGC